MDERPSVFGSDPDRIDRLLAWPVRSDAEPVLAFCLEQFAEGPGGQIGRYKLLRPLGEGGMGVVYLAEQQEPVRREVALKVLKPGMDSKAVLARFEAEQQALAILEHPYIAHVYDAGLAPSGRPYFVMEHVDGLPITEYCDRQELSISERLRVFLHVCEAVQHAHQKGIIHRDLKPSNILVVREGKEAAPKVIDFGVARATKEPRMAQTPPTEQGQLVGTPEYMSPEQFEASQDIDTRTDIYSLGLVLYQLLTGLLPFDVEMSRTAGFEYIRKIIREQDPPKPSTRLTTLGRELEDVARQRRVTTDQLRKSVRGDLDWIVMKTLEKDRTRRYGSVGELAADIRRHVDHEPVAAGPPSTMYRLRKCMRRHRALVTGLAAVLAVLLAGLAGVVTFALKANRQARTAEAVAGFLINDLLGSLTPEQLKSPGVKVRFMLDNAARSLDGKFTEQPLEEARIRHVLGELYITLGDYPAAEPQLQRAYDIRRECLGNKDRTTLATMSQLGRLHFLRARYQEAKPLLQESWTTRMAVLGRDDAQTLESSAWLGLLYLYESAPGDADRAEKLLTETYDTAARILGKNHPVTLETLYGLAFLHGLLWGRFGEAASSCLEGLQIAEQVFGKEHRLALQFTTLSAWLYAWQGDYDRAEAQALAALETGRRVLGDEHPETLLALGALGWVYAMQHQYEQAGRCLADASRLSSHILGQKHACTLSLTRYLAWTYLGQGQYRRARELLTGVIDSQDVLGKEHPTMLDALSGMAGLSVMEGEADGLKAWSAKEIERLRQTPDESRPTMAFVLSTLGWWQAVYPVDTVRNGLEAMQNATRACELTDWQSDRSLATLAAACAETGDFDAAVRWQEKAIAAWRGNGGRSGVSDKWLRYNARLFQAHRPLREGVLTGQGRYLIANERFDKAEQELTRALEASRRCLGERHPETHACILVLIELYEAWGRPGEAEKWRAQLPSEGPAAQP